MFARIDPEMDGVFGEGCGSRLTCNPTEDIHGRVADLQQGATRLCIDRMSKVDGKAIYVDAWVAMIPRRTHGSGPPERLLGARRPKPSGHLIKKPQLCR